MIPKWSEAVTGVNVTTFLRWDGEDVKIVSNKPYRWFEDKWIECDEKTETKYYDGIIGANNIPMFKNPAGGVPDGMYTLIGPHGDNPYHFRMFMLMPHDFFSVALPPPVTLKGITGALRASPCSYGFLFQYGDGTRYEATRKDVGLDWPTKDCENLFGAGAAEAFGEEKTSGDKKVHLM